MPDAVMRSHRDHIVPPSVTSLRILNLGCGTKTSASCINFDWSPYLQIKRNPLLHFVAKRLLRGARRERLKSLPDSIVVHDLRKGIPKADWSADVVYHSHLLEHLDRDAAPVFLHDVLKALRPGGIHRVVVPDLETLCRSYLAGLDCPTDPVTHETRIGAMIEQMVRRQPFGARQQPAPWRQIEQVVLGDARARGETHQWMYDRINLTALLEQVGFTDIVLHCFDTSDIPSWNAIGLDLDSKGAAYKPDSLYVECRRPMR